MMFLASKDAEFYYLPERHSQKTLANLDWKQDRKNLC